MLSTEAYNAAILQYDEISGQAFIYAKYYLAFQHDCSPEDFLVTDVELTKESIVFCYEPNCDGGSSYSTTKVLPVSEFLEWYNSHMKEE